MRFGLPKVITSDQGKEFNNELNDELAQRLGIEHRVTTPYHPQVCINVHIIVYFKTIIKIPSLLLICFMYMCRQMVLMRGGIKRYSRCL